jgi:catechol 2,3-dioxygenase-like lactoylglutathione lyase family enzyme
MESALKIKKPVYEPKRGDSVIKPAVLSHGTLEITDMKASRKFYEEFLGLEVVRMGRPALALRCGMKFHIVAVQVGNTDRRASVLQHWGLEVATKEEVDQAYKRAHELKDKYGIKQILEPVLQHGVYSFYFEDLDYNWWEIQNYDGFQHDDFFDFGDRIPMEMDATVENMREMSIKSSR